MGPCNLDRDFHDNEQMWLSACIFFSSNFNKFFSKENRLLTEIQS